jgi:antitoxin component YwqK of YwqJK toxin-antitoxin module
MVQSLDAALYYALTATATVSAKAVRQESEYEVGSAPQLDVVSISEEAIQRFKAEFANAAMLSASEQEQAAEQKESPWKLPSGKNHAEHSLKNGHTEVIDIDGDRLEIREYDGDRLVKFVEGTMMNGRAIMDTSFYDESGKVSQTIHAELNELTGKNKWTGARMTRSVEWFKDGKSTRTLDDEMFLQTRNHDGQSAGLSVNTLNKMTDVRVDKSEDLVKFLTSEDHIVDYHATIQEFHENGRLAKNMIIEQSGKYTQESNRNMVKVGGMEPVSTRELSHASKLIINTSDYDEDGELLREASVSDVQKDSVGQLKGTQLQTADISWYKDGELVKRGHGSFEVDESASCGLMHRPGILDLLGMKPEEYLTLDPQEAVELLGRKALESSAEASFFIDGLGEGIAKGEYGTATATAEYGHKDRPYSADWTTELYEEGELVMRKKDSERAVDAPDRGVDDRLPFRTGGGLTDGEHPVVLEQADHTVELLRDGETTAMESMEAKEILQPSEAGPDTLMTLANYDRLNDDGKDGLNVFYKGGLDEADPDAHAAARSMGAEFDLTMDSVYEIYKSVRGGPAAGMMDSIVRYAPVG